MRPFSLLNGDALRAGLIALAFLAACASPTAGRDSGREVVMTGQADGAPTGCSPQAVTQRLTDLFAAVSRGDPDLVDEFFGRAAQAPFGWYSLNDRLGNFVAYSWEELDGYWKERFQQRERLQLRSIQFNGWEAERGLVHFGPLSAARSADDLGQTEQLIEGKGAYHCETRAVIVLSLAEAEVAAPTEAP